MTSSRETSSIDEWLALLKSILDKARAEQDSSGPFFPPVLTLALHIESALREGRIDDALLGQMIQTLAMEGVFRRGRALSRRLGICSSAENDALLESALYAMARKPDGSQASFEEYRSRLESTLYGFVFTAHPTFSMDRPQSRALAQYALEPDESAQDVLVQAFSTRPQIPDLDEETAHALEAIAHLRAGIERLRRLALDVAATLYPTEWTALRPALSSVATWVGFDLDGRSDIAWTGVLARRMNLQSTQLAVYADRLEFLSRTAPSDARQLLQPACTRVLNALAALRNHYRFFSTYDPDHDPGHLALQEASRALISDSSQRLTSPQPLLDLLEPLVGRSDFPDGFRKDVAALAGALRHDGLSRAQVHFRINAAQMHNAIRKHVDLTTHPADPRFRQMYIDRLMKRFGAVEPAHIHLGNVLEEQASARRLFMLIQFIVRHIDSDSPIRFLIAETESSLTVLAALYLARRFGVDHHVDICPLFETERALERGSRIVGHLLDIPEFVAYIRARGRLCIQTGYSDAGRYIGQSAAAGSIERVKERIVRLMDERGLKDIALVFFDTHGESCGRGGHPGSLSARMDYIAPPALRQLAEEKGLSLVQESSWQGGDGFLWFMTHGTAYATMTRIMTHWLTPAVFSQADPLYGSDRPAATEFLTIIKSFQSDLMASPDYGALLSAFGSNLMRPTGSRAIKRQHEGRRIESRSVEAREFRAIPHNAILAQMGFLANSVSGLGSAVRADPLLFDRLVKNSPRFSNVIGASLYAVDQSDIEILRSYVLTLDPQLWLQKEKAFLNADQSTPSEACAEVALHLEHHSPFESLLRVFRAMKRDDTALKRVIPGHIPARSDESLFSVFCLHAIRLALTHRLFSLAMEIPNYSPMHDIPRSGLIDLVFRLDIPTVMRELAEIFPVHPGHEQAAHYGEDSTYISEERESYAVEHNRIFQPIERLYTRVQDISAALIHHIGFVG